ncbi:protein lev-9 [Caerostris darwini]|uniref:Protein lev-9 n=1 Tax=Caerostris darwini TaxID=1538125 RepID=A0AAV4T1Q6_9ARAC|nr:protein lev-9 [Caerostris darwini]
MYITVVLSRFSFSNCTRKCRACYGQLQCVAGCPNLLKTKDPELLVKPDKDFYRFGESVTLACNPGYVLSSEVVRLMCLGSTWSETELRHCQEE